MENFVLPPAVKISDQVLFQEIEGECVLLNLKNEQYFGLNEIATRMWQLLSINPKTDLALRSLLDEYNVSEEILRNDMAVIIRDMQNQNLVIIE
jgi:hypothetical protein